MVKSCFLKSERIDLGKSYYYPTLYFKKKWYWFRDPFEAADADMVTFFSYHKVDARGFKRKEGLTTVINLEQDQEKIWLAMRKSFVRRQIKRGERNGIKVRADNNFKDFKKIYTAFRRAKKIPSDNYQVFVQNGRLFSAYYQGKMVAGGVFIAAKPYIRAWVLASLRMKVVDGRMRDIIGQANRLVIWEAIKTAKKEGFKVFDLGGINPVAADASQRSLAEFKESFGGTRKKHYYYRKIYSPLLKKIMKIKKIMRNYGL